jgi:hypothetical protein
MVSLAFIRMHLMCVSSSLRRLSDSSTPNEALEPRFQDQMQFSRPLCTFTVSERAVLLSTIE